MPLGGDFMLQLKQNQIHIIQPILYFFMAQVLLFHLNYSLKTTFTLFFIFICMIVIDDCLELFYNPKKSQLFHGLSITLYSLLLVALIIVPQLVIQNLNYIFAIIIFSTIPFYLDSYVRTKKFSFITVSLIHSLFIIIVLGVSYVAIDNLLFFIGLFYLLDSFFYFYLWYVSHFIEHAS